MSLKGRAQSASKKLPEPLRRQGGMARRVLDIAMPEIRLDRSGVVSVVGELVASGMPQHCEHAP
jgi:hypothetical protein